MAQTEGEETKAGKPAVRLLPEVKKSCPCGQDEVVIDGNGRDPKHIFYGAGARTKDLVRGAQ